MKGAVDRRSLERFFQSLVQRNFAEAERALSSMRGAEAEGEWLRGFFAAVEGMLVARKSRDELAFVNLSLIHI